VSEEEIEREMRDMKSEQARSLGHAVKEEKRTGEIER
jgi:hypothetical protein